MALFALQQTSANQHKALLWCQKLELLKKKVYYLDLKHWERLVLQQNAAGGQASIVLIWGDVTMHWLTPHAASPFFPT